MGTPKPLPPGQHYFAAEPSVASSPRTVRLVLPDLQIDLTTDRGVFAGQAVDPGTKLLLAAAPPPPPEGDVLDLGCGYGAIAVVAALRSPRARVWAVDVNRRALALTAENARRAGCGARVQAVVPEKVPPEVRFSAVYSNPPVRIGKAALHELCGTWLPRVEPATGRAWLVVHKHLGSDSLARWLTEQGYGVERLVSRMGYRVLGVSPP